MTACGHILCHDHGIEAFHRQESRGHEDYFLCPVCQKSKTMSEVTELNFQGDHMSKTDIKTIMSFMVEKPTEAMKFLGDVISFRDSQKVLVLEESDRRASNQENDMNEMKRRIMNSENYAREMEAKAVRHEARGEELEKAMSELRRQRDALQKSYKDLCEQRMRPDHASQAYHPQTPTFAKRQNANRPGIAQSPAPTLSMNMRTQMLPPDRVYREGGVNRGHNRNDKPLVSPYFQHEKSPQRMPPPGYRSFSSESFSSNRSRSKSPHGRHPTARTPVNPFPNGSSSARSVSPLPPRSIGIKFPSRPQTPLLKQYQHQQQKQQQRY